MTKKLKVNDPHPCRQINSTQPLSLSIFRTVHCCIQKHAQSKNYLRLRLNHVHEKTCYNYHFLSVFLVLRLRKLQICCSRHLESPAKHKHLNMSKR